MGAVVGWVASQVRRRLDQPEVEIAISVLTAYGAFLAADRLEVSGILAAVVAGLIMGRRSPREIAPATRMRALAFWEPHPVLRGVDAVPADRAPVRAGAGHRDQRRSWARSS